jgi:hypothetical protein
VKENTVLREIRALKCGRTEEEAIGEHLGDRVVRGHRQANGFRPR